MRIVAFVDRSLYAQSVVDHALWLARSKNADVDLVQIVSPNELMAARMPPIHPGGPVVLDRDSSLDQEIAELKSDAQERLEAARALIASQVEADVRTQVLEGNVPNLMAECTKDASLAIMGKRGEHADLARLPLGSNFEHFVRKSKVPVLAVSRSFRPIHRMLIAVDLDPAAASAIETVARGMLPEMPIRLLHVGTANERLQAELGSAEARLIGAGHQVTTEVAEGIARVVVPARVVSDNIDIVAMGAFGGSRLKSLIFGSLTTELIRACQVPILLCQ
jgi:nucleotide-binding universal stress UspA family protein